MIKIPVINNNSKLNVNLSRNFFIAKKNLSMATSNIVSIGGSRLFAPTNSVNELGKKLLKAAEEGDIEETKSLLNNGALFTANWLGISPLHLASRYNHLDICEILLRAGISKEARTKVDRTSLHEAACAGHLRIVEILLEYGCDPDCRDMLGMTPLHWAVQRGHCDIVCCLLKQFPQTNVVNKFGLTPMDIAEQLKRHDILEVLNKTAEGPLLASQQLSLHLVGADDSNESNFQVMEQSPTGSSIPLETILQEGNESSLEQEKTTLNQTEGISEQMEEDNIITQDSSFAESIKLLQEHGITMLPNDDSNILTTVMETGHSVVLTDVGKEVLNSIKQSEQRTADALEQRLMTGTITKPSEKNQKIIKLTPEEFLALTSNYTNKINNTNVLRQVNGKLIAKPVKRVTMKKGKLLPITSVNNVYTIDMSSANTEVQTLMKQLQEAHKTIEEYKFKLLKKEEEAERYKKQLKLLMDAS